MSILSNDFLVIERIRNFIGKGVTDTDITIYEVLKNIFFLGHKAGKFDPKNGTICGFLELVVREHLPVVEVSNDMGDPFAGGLQGQNHLRGRQVIDS